MRRMCVPGVPGSFRLRWGQLLPPLARAPFAYFSLADLSQPQRLGAGIFLEFANERGGGNVKAIGRILAAIIVDPLH